MKTTALAVAGLCGTAFIGYCIYFDKKRRSHPDFKKKLLEKRRAEKAHSERSTKVVFPDLRNVEEVQKFFLEQVQKGEEFMANGQIEEGVDHLTNAVAVCGQPQQLLSVLQNTLPREVFQLLANNLSTIGERLATSPTMAQVNKPKPGSAVGGGDDAGPKITEVTDSVPSVPPASGDPPTPQQLDASASIIDVDELE